MGIIRYPSDYRGYDGLFTFTQVFDSYEKFKQELNAYMFDTAIGAIEPEQEDEALDKKIFNVFLLKYKNHYFRYRNASTIFNKTAIEFTKLYKEYAIVKKFADNEILTSNTTNNKNYKTNNGAEGHITKYQINESDTTTLDPRLYIDYENSTINRSAFINERIEKMRNLFMNQINEVVIKEGVFTKND